MKLCTRRIGRIDEDCDAPHGGHQLAQQLQPLRHKLAEEKVDAGQVATRPGEAGDKPELDRILGDGEHDRNRAGRRLGGDGRSGAAARDDDCNLSAHQIGRHGRQPIELVFGPPVFDRKVRAFRIADVFHALVKGLQAIGKTGGRHGAEEPDHRHLLLSACRKRPKNRRRRRRAAEQRDQLPAVHSITSAARRRRAVGSSMPMALGESTGDALRARPSRTMNARRPRPGMTSSFSAVPASLMARKQPRQGRRFAAAQPASGWLAGPWGKAELF
jgi:hypothetical protein